MNINCNREGGGNIEHGYRVVNETLTDNQRINANELFRDVFHPNIKYKYRSQRPKYDEGETCHRYHAIGLYNTT